MAKKEMEHCSGHTGKHIGMVILGLLILANAYWNVINWGLFVGGVFFIVGLIKWIFYSK